MKLSKTDLERMAKKCKCSPGLLDLVLNEGKTTHPFIAARIVNAMNLTLEDFHRMIPKEYETTVWPLPWVDPPEETSRDHVSVGGDWLRRKMRIVEKKHRMFEWIHRPQKNEEGVNWNEQTNIFYSRKTQRQGPATFRKRARLHSRDYGAV